jgi:hypothetical protein
LSMAESDLKQILRITVRWMKAWGIGGLVVGILMMLGKTAPFAESGSHSGSVWSYGAWVPAATVFGAAGGLAIGFVYGVLLTLTENWRRPYESQPSAAGRYIPRVLCGAVAGMILTVPPLGSRGALLFAALAGGTACAMTALDVRAKPNG